jgi:tripartite-type tricarboxylate transporter receptor subunit TctC
LALGITAGFASTAAGQSDDRFYEGRQVKLVVGAALSGSFGIRARLVSRFMGHHLPGNPEFVLQSISGASGVGAASYVYAAPKDGSIIGTFNSALPFYQAMGQPGLHFRSDELSWIGSLGRVVSVIIVWHDLGVMSIEDAKTRDIIVGATGVRGTTATYPALLNNMFGTRFKVITGYDNNANIYVALERGEVQGVGGAYWSSYKAAKPDWIRDGKVVPLLQMNTKKDPDLPQVPLVTELATTDEQREVLDFILANTAYEYPFAAPPGLAPQRLATLRRAFDGTVRDPAFLAQAERQLVEVEPLTGEELTTIVRRILATPPSVVAKAQEAMTLRDNRRRPGAGADKTKR